MELNSIFGIHERALEFRAARTEILANNIANADTPKFQAVDIDFQQELNKNMPSSGGLNVSNARHIRPNGLENEYHLIYSHPPQASMDKNTVDVDEEKIKFTKNWVQYQTSLEFLSDNIQQIRKAIKGE